MLIDHTHSMHVLIEIPNLTYWHGSMFSSFNLACFRADVCAQRQQVTTVHAYMGNCSELMEDPTWLIG